MYIRAMTAALLINILLNSKGCKIGSALLHWLTRNEDVHLSSCVSYRFLEELFR